MQPDIALHRARRERVIEKMGAGVMILATAPEVIRNRDAHYSYRYDSHFHYLTAFPEPEAVLVLIAGDADKTPPKHILFCREKNMEREIWDGFRFGRRQRANFSVSTPPTPTTHWMKSCPNCWKTSRRCTTPSASTQPGTRACWAG